MTKISKKQKHKLESKQQQKESKIIHGIPNYHLCNKWCKPEIHIHLHGNCYSPIDLKIALSVPHPGEDPEMKGTGDEDK